MTLDRSQIFATTAAPADPTVAVTGAPTATEPPPVEPVASETETEHVSIRLDETPGHIARLVVTQHGKDHYGIEGFHATELLPRLVVPRSEKYIVDVQTSDGMRTYLHLLRDVQAVVADGIPPPRPFQELALWIKRLRSLHGDDLALVIVEHTATGIPWEMLRVEKSHLGAVATTVRWKHVVGLDDETRRIEDLPRIHKGALFSCPETAPANAPDVLPETLNLVRTHVGAVGKLATETCASLKEWRQHLRAARRDVGLVYVLCHGIWTDPQSAQLKSVAGPDAVRFGELIDDQEDVCAVVFINACASGVVEAITDYLPERQLVGFAEPFLRRGAAAVIGTISQVRLSHAASFGLELIQATKAAPDRSLAVIVRELRRNAVIRLAAETTDARDAWFYTFHYVLWGSPALCLELS